MHWSVIKKTSLYQGFFKLFGLDIRHELFNGGESPQLRRELLDRGHAVAVLPYDPVRDELVLIEQFRIGAMEDASGPWLIEVIAGYQEPDEPAEEVARREALEEAGCTLTELTPVHRYYSSPGSSTEQIHLYLGRTHTPGLGGIHGLDHEGEDIRVHVIAAKTAFEWLDQGRIDSAMPIIALQWFRCHHQQIRSQWMNEDFHDAD
jgi:ADP-ribose pyrophosphatase